MTSGPATSGKPRHAARRPNAVRDLVDADRALALLRELIQAASSGPGVEPLAAAAARMITAATATDVCFVHVVDDSGRSLTLAGATPPFDGQVEAGGPRGQEDGIGAPGPDRLLDALLRAADVGKPVDVLGKLAHGSSPNVFAVSYTSFIIR